jgi:serine/threonine protein kinase
VIAPNKKNMTGNVGTVSFIAPEVFENKPYDATADVYSFGMVMWGSFFAWGLSIEIMANARGLFRYLLDRVAHKTNSIR